MTVYSCIAKPVGFMTIISSDNYDNPDKINVQYKYESDEYIKLYTITNIANFLRLQIGTVNHILYEQVMAKVTAKNGVKAEPKLRLGFSVNDTNEAFVEFLYKTHDTTQHLKYKHTITSWTKINTIAKICSARRYSYDEAEKLLDLVMYDGDKYIEE